MTVILDLAYLILNKKFKNVELTFFRPIGLFNSNYLFPENTKTNQEFKNGVVKLNFLNVDNFYWKNISFKLNFSITHITFFLKLYLKNQNDYFFSYI